jgi:hypothetical protein
MLARCFFISLSLAAAMPATAAPQPGRADLVDLALAAPVIARADVVKASRLSDKLAPGLAPGHKRHLVRARIVNVLTAPGYVPREIEYLVDLPADSRGRPAKLKGRPVLLFLQGARLESQFRLVQPWAQIDWSAEREAYVRSIAAEAIRSNRGPLQVTGLGQAFHVPGSLPGEAESQIFVQTASGDTMALVVLSRPGQQRTFSVATGDIIDEAAGSVTPGSLLWYQLACHLPPDLPDTSIETLDAETAAAARDDYRFVIEALGPCDRQLGR